MKLVGTRSRGSEWSPPEGSEFDLSPRGVVKGDLFYCSALAWICTGDRALTSDLHEVLKTRSPSMGEALRLLDERLADLKRSAIIMSRVEAAEQLSDAVWAGGVGATTAVEQIGLVRIGCFSWVTSDVSDGARHDERVDLNGSVSHRGVRFDQRQVLARWPLLYRLGGESWSLGATVYWVERRTHHGYRPKGTGRLGMMCSDAMVQIREKLRAGSISCEAAVCAGVPGLHPSERSMRRRDLAFWIGHGLGDLSSARFDPKEIMDAWKPSLAEYVRGLGRGDARDVLMAPPHNMNRESATALARDHAEDRRGKTPRRKKANDGVATEAK